MTCFSQIILRFIQIILNLIITAGGSVLLAFGILFTENENYGIHVFGNFKFGILSLVIGALVMGTGVFGIISIFFRSSICMKFYAAILLGIFVIQLSLGIMSVNKIEKQQQFFEEIQKLMQKLFDENKQEFLKLEQNFDCFGVEECNLEFRDWTQYYIQVIGFTAIIFSVIELMVAFFALSIQKKNQERLEQTVSDNWY